MVSARRQSGRMVQVRTVMGLAMVCLMPAGPIRGLAEALGSALAEVSAEASVGAAAAVAAEADLVIGSRFKLALNCRED